MVKTGWTVLKIGIQSALGPNSPMEFGTLDFKKLGRPIVQQSSEQRDPLSSFNRKILHIARQTFRKVEKTSLKL